MTKKTILTIVLLTNSLLFFGQNSINTSAKDLVTSTGSISYSIGQLFVENSLTSNGSIFNGIQTPFENNIVLGLEDKKMGIGIEAYPNPVVNNLIIALNNTETKDLSYKVYNTLGLKLMNGKISEIKTNLNFEHLPSTMYLINIYQNNKIIKVFKILRK